LDSHWRKKKAAETQWAILKQSQKAVNTGEEHSPETVKKLTRRSGAGGGQGKTGNQEEQSFKTLRSQVDRQK